MQANESASETCLSPFLRRRPLVLWGLAGLVGLLAYVATYERAHPEAALRLEIGRHEALTLAQDWLEEQGHSVDGYRHAVTFSTRYQTKQFLEKELGPAEANRMMSDEVPVWFWRVRYFVPEQEEEFHVGVSTVGALVYFLHEIPEGHPGASLDAGAARTLAERFLEKLSPLPLDRLEPADEFQQERPERLDHTFTWKRIDFEAAGAEHRFWVSIAGDALGSYGEYTKIPEAWERGQSRQYAQRAFLQRIATWAHWGLAAAVLFVLFLKLRSRTLDYRMAATIWLVLAVLPFLHFFNATNLAWMHYQTTESPNAFVLNRLMETCAQMGFAMMAFLVVMAADALARDVFPDTPHAASLHRRRFWQSVPAVSGVFVGLCLAVVHAGYYNVFYLFAQSLGAWCPQQAPYTGSLATPMPWLYPLTTGLEAAVNEEFMYRLFAVALLYRVTKRKWIAVLVPAVVWAFLHSTYPQEPVYIRGLELTVIGILYALVALRWGIVATLTAHYTYNALAGSVLLLKSDAPYLRLSGAIVVALMLAPILPGLWRLVRGKTLISTREVLSWQQTKRVPAPPALVHRVHYPLYVPLTGKALVAVLVMGAAGVLFCAVSFRLPAFGDYVRFEVNRREARHLADRYAAELGIATEEYRCVVSASRGLGGDEADYVWQHLEGNGIERIRALNEIFAQHRPDKIGWHARYFKPLEEEAHYLTLSPRGELLSYEPTPAEDAPGASLTKAEARGLAEGTLRTEWAVDLDDYRFVEDGTRERPARLDHFFTWEYAGALPGEGGYRLSCWVRGNEAMGPQRFVHIPDDWERAREERSTFDAVREGAAMVVLGTAGLILLLLTIWLIRLGYVDLRGLWPVALAAAALQAMASLCKWELLWNAYRTTSPPELYLSSTLLDWFVWKPVMAFALALGMLALGDAFLRHAFPQGRRLRHYFGLGWREHGFRSGPPLGLIWAEALVIAACVAALLEGSGDLGDRVIWGFEPASETVDIMDEAPPARTPGASPVSVPGLWIVLSEALNYNVAGGIFLVLALFARYFNTPRRTRWLCASLAVLLAWMDAEDPAEAAGMVFAAYLGLRLAIGGVRLAVRHVFRDNLPACLLACVFTGIFSKAAALAHARNAFERANGIFIIACCVVLTAVALWLYWRKRRAYLDALFGKGLRNL